MTYKYIKYNLYTKQICFSKYQRNFKTRRKHFSSMYAYNYVGHPKSLGSISVAP